MGTDKVVKNIAVNSKNDMIYPANSDSGSVFIVSGAKNKTLHSVGISGVSYALCLGPGSAGIYVTTPAVDSLFFVRTSKSVKEKGETPHRFRKNRKKVNPSGVGYFTCPGSAFLEKLWVTGVVRGKTQPRPTAGFVSQCGPVCRASGCLRSLFPPG